MKRFIAEMFSRRRSLSCSAVALATAAAVVLYIYGSPGDYIEPGTWWKLGTGWLLFTAALCAQLLLGQRPGRLVYFAFPGVLALEEALNFAPPDRFYASQQLCFALLLAGWLVIGVMGIASGVEFPRDAAMERLAEREPGKRQAGRTAGRRLRPAGCNKPAGPKSNSRAASRCRISRRKDDPRRD